MVKRARVGRPRSIRPSSRRPRPGPSSPSSSSTGSRSAAPFAGRVLSVPVSSGQFVLKGTVIAEVADVTRLKALVPVDRRGVKAGTDATVFVEEQEQSAKVQSVVPLLEAFSQLRELAAPFASAWIHRAQSQWRARAGPAGPQRDLAQHADRDDPQGRREESRGLPPGSQGSHVQVIRSEYVTNVPVEVLGKVGPRPDPDHRRVPAHRRADCFFVSPACSPGTLVRFAQGSSSGIEGTTPSPARQGIEAGITPPGRTAGAAAGSGDCACGVVANPPRGSARPAARGPAGACWKQGSTPF